MSKLNSYFMIVRYLKQFEKVGCLEKATKIHTYDFFLGKGNIQIKTSFQLKKFQIN